MDTQIDTRRRTVNTRVSKMVSGAGILSVGLVGWGCADLDNPTALADLRPVTEFEVEFAEVETMQALEIHARVREGGSPMRLSRAQLEVQPPLGPTRIIPLRESEDGYGARVRFYEPGEHQIYLFGQPEKNHFMRELGEQRIDVERQHRLHGDEHRFEIAVDPAPIVEGAPAHVALYAFALEADGTVGQETEGLDLRATLHMPDGAEIPVDFSEREQGEYETEFQFPAAGSYGLSIEVGGASEQGAGGVEFEIYVPSSSGVPDDTPDDGGSDGH